VVSGGEETMTTTTKTKFTCESYYVEEDGPFDSEGWEFVEKYDYSDSSSPSMVLDDVVEKLNEGCTKFTMVLDEGDVEGNWNLYAR